jgi:hypothetical protein
MEVNEEFIESVEVLREPDKSGGLIQAGSKNINVFAEKMLGIRPYAWQAYWMDQITQAVNDKEIPREFLALTSRQVGKSTALAIMATWMCVYNKYPGTVGNSTIFGIVSASDVQAKKLLYEIKKLLRMGDRFMERTYKDDNGDPVFGKNFFSDLLDENEPNNTTTITFKPYNQGVHGEFLLKDSLSGSTIKSYPPTSSVLGETFTVVVIDEAGKTDKITDQFFYDYMYPTGNSTNAIRIYTSTPWVSSGFFYRLVNPDNNYSDSGASTVTFTIDSIKLENPKYYKTVMKTVDQLNADGKTDEVQRAYYCRFVKGESAYFNPERVIDMFTNEYQPYEQYREPCDMGIDFGGQVTSKSVITISSLGNDGKIRRLYRRVYEVGKDNNLIEDVEELLSRFNVQRIIPDDCPQGDYLIRQMEEKGWNINRMSFRKEKVKKYGAFRSSLNKNHIESFEDDELRTEMLALEIAEGSRQSKIQHAPGYSDDLIDSFIMSCYFFVQEEGGFKIFTPDSVLAGVDECPACGSESLERRDTGKALEITCRDCRNKWVEEDDSIYE